MTPSPSVRSWVVALSLVSLVGCGRSTERPAATPPQAPVPLSGPLNVYAAASLTGAFSAAKSALVDAHPALSLNFNFGGSNALVAQILQGAPADVFASADAQNMRKLVDAGLVDPPVTFARNKLEIAVAPGNPKHVSSLTDLARPDVTTVLAAPGVPAGDYSRQVLAAKKITVNPRSLEADVKAAVAKVASGDADAVVVYATDITAAGAKVSGVEIPDADQPVISYPIAVVKTSAHHAAAQAFVDSAVKGDVRRALGAAGFSAP